VALCVALILFSNAECRRTGLQRRSIACECLRRARCRGRRPARLSFEVGLRIGGGFWHSEIERAVCAVAYLLWGGAHVV